MEKLERTSERMRDLQSDIPNETVYHLPTLGSRAEASVREACRERRFLFVHDSQASWTNPTWELCYVPSRATQVRWAENWEEGRERLGMYGQSAEKDGQVEVSSKTKYDLSTVPEHAL